MSRLMEADDFELLTSVRGGDTTAMAELWSRHYPATLVAARRISRQPRDAEELASDAFAAMLQALSNDGGPTTSVRSYLLTTVRNQAASRARRASSSDVLTGEVADYESLGHGADDPVARSAELGLVREAFASLPRRWQTVLWRTAVDHDANKAIAADLEMSPNAVAALARRARKGFRTAYIQAHASYHHVSPDCEPYASRLVELLPNSGSKPGASADVREHVDHCDECSRRLVALMSADKDLRGILLPALLGLGPGIAWATTAHSTHAIGALWFKLGHGGGQAGQVAAIGAAAAVVVAAGALSAYAVSREDEGPARDVAATTHHATPTGTAPTGAPRTHTGSDRSSMRDRAHPPATPHEGASSAGRTTHSTPAPSRSTSAATSVPTTPVLRDSGPPSPTSSSRSTRTPPPVVSRTPSPTATSSGRPSTSTGTPPPVTSTTSPPVTSPPSTRTSTSSPVTSTSAPSSTSSTSPTSTTGPTSSPSPTRTCHRFLWWRCWPPRWPFG